MWNEIIEWITINKLDSAAGVLGIIVTFIGFAITILNVYRSKSAAERAEDAAIRTRESIRRFDTISDFSTAVSTIDEIKRLHREAAWASLPDRYASLRRTLISIRSSNPELNEDQLSVLQGAITNLRAMESRIERDTGSVQGPKQIAKMNSVLSDQADRLFEILVEMKSSTGAD